MIYNHRFHRLTQIVSEGIQKGILECVQFGENDQPFGILLDRKKRIGENP
jgi:hypothetical protein